MPGKEVSVHRKCVVLFPTVSSQPPANCLRELPKKDLLSLYKMQSSCWTFLSCICPNTFWTSANLWHQVWLVAVSLTLCVLPGVFFLFFNLIISFHAALLLHGVRQWTSLLTCSRGTSCRSAKFLPNSSTTIPSQKKKETLKPHLCLQR